MRLGLLFLNIVSLSLIIALSGSAQSFAAVQPSDVPDWLRAHVKAKVKLRKWSREGAKVIDVVETQAKRNRRGHRRRSSTAGD